jgi:hypothetical protein
MSSDPTVDPDLQFVFVHFPLPHRSPGAIIEAWGALVLQPGNGDPACPTTFTWAKRCLADQ